MHKSPNARKKCTKRKKQRRPFLESAPKPEVLHPAVASESEEEVVVRAEMVSLHRQLLRREERVELFDVAAEVVAVGLRLVLLS